MAARYLLNLHRFADAPPSEIRTRDAALFAEMQTRVLARARAYLRTSFPRMSPALRDHLINADLPLSDWPRDRTPREVILQTLDGRRVTPEVRAEAARVLAELEEAGMLPAGADMARAIRQLPFFEQELRQARVAVVADAAGLPEPKSEELLKQVDSLASLNEDHVAALVRGGVLQQDEARRLTITTNLYRIAGAHVPLMTALATESFASLGGRRVNQARDLAALTAVDWEGVLTRAGVRPEPGTDIRATAATFERTMAAMFPTDALFARAVPRNAASTVAPALDRMAPVLSPTVFDRAFDEIPVEGLTPAQVTAAREAHAELQRLVNLHPGLRLGEVLGSSIPAAQKVQTVQTRLALLEKVSGLNPDLELLTLDHKPDSADLQALKLDGLAVEEQQMVLSELKAHQRAFGITGDPIDAVALLGGGYSSARAAATVPFDEFRANTGLPEMTAKKYYQEAKQILGDAAVMVTGVADAISGGFDKIALAGNIEKRPMYAHLNKLQGFADLFGSQDYCACEHCQSILGPAAYFVDLMLFVEETTGKFFKGTKKTHALHLKVRRPDLWKLELTCENTNTLVPTLDIINEILENAIAVKRNFAGNFADRAAVEEEVYHQAISNAVDSFRQPFTLPLEKLSIYLTHVDRSRADVALALAAPNAVLASAALGLSQREYDLVTQPNVALPFLRAVYGIQFTVGSDSKVAPVDVQEMLKFTGLSRKDFGSLVATKYVTAGGADPVEIKGEKKSSDSLQNDVERIRNLTPAALDRLHRLTRVWRKLGWSVAETDLALTHLAVVNLAADIGTAALDHLATVVLLRTRWSNVPVEQALALWSAIPAAPVIEGRKSLLDRLFNVAPFVTADGPLPNAAVSFVHPSLRQSGTPLPSDNTLNRLLAGLQLSEDHLGQLITRLAAPLGANLAAANENDRGFALSLANLTLLYRHARLTQLLRLPVADIFQLVSLAGIASGHVAAIADLSQLLEFQRWWKSSGFKLDDLAVVTKGPVQFPAQYPDGASTAAQIVADLTSERALQFADTVFAFVPGVTEDQSRQIVAANGAAIERTPDGSAYRLRDTFNPQTPLTIPPAITLTQADARAALLQHHASVLIPLRLGSRFGFALDKTIELVAMTGADLSSAPVVNALWNGPVAPLVTIVERAAPLAILFRHAVFDAPALQFVRAQPALVAITDFNAIGMTAVRKLSVYAAWSDPAKVAVDAPEGTKADPAAVRASLTAFDPVAKFGAAAQADLAKALRVDPVLLATLLPNLTLPSAAVDALDMVGRAAALAVTLGVGGEALRMMISNAYADLSRASDALLSSLRARYPEEKDFADRMEPLLDKLRSRRRDALTDYLIRSAHPQFHSLNELYAYYLVDVQLEGCARTSRLVCATSGVQLYVQRCILDLEQDTFAPNSPNHVHVTIAPDAIDEWAWRKNYRVWEANRKVLLYPESYIEPELRDDKTPLFKELEGTLLQQRINEQNVLDAYATYLAGLEEVTRLKIAGAYHDIGSDRDRLHLFGVLPGDPPLYYYRTVENAYHGETGEHRTPVYTPWRKIDVQIPVRHVSPIVYLGRLFVFWVEIATAPKNQVAEGGSKFVGYKHKLTVRYTSLRLDGTWTPAQSITLARTGVFKRGAGIVNDPLEDEIPKFDDKKHPEPIDDYTLEGFQFDRVYPAVLGNDLILTGRNFSMRAPVDFYRKLLRSGSAGTRQHSPADGQVLCARRDEDARRLYYGVQDKFQLEDFAQTMLVADQDRLDMTAAGESESALTVICATEGLYKEAIAQLKKGDEIEIINGAVTDAIIDSDGDLLLLQGSVRPGPDYLLKRLGTTLTEKLVRKLFMAGVDGLLDLSTQKLLKEKKLPLSSLAHIEDAMNSGKLDFKGPYGTYYREVFFQIPFLIANFLNSQGQFAACQDWYYFIFNPTSTEQVTLPPNLSAEERVIKLRNRVWRYLEFRDLALPKLKDMLSDPETIEIYRKDPFNPHAIARLRLSAYQKCIVMKVIDNWLDWGEFLHAQFTTESLNEATMLYVMAADVLGPRPAELGSCGEAKVTPRNYETIGPLMKAGEGFLAEIETHVVSSHSRIRARGSRKRADSYVLRESDVGFYAKKGAAVAKRAAAPAAVSEEIAIDSGNDVAYAYGWQGMYTKSWAAEKSGSKQAASKQTLAINSPQKDVVARAPGFTWSVARQIVTVFCVPPNKELLAYWDRVEDRLYKLRHCLDINGVFRRPALFAPEIDPRLLVRARAAGLSLDDVLNATSGNLPPYRFSYLIEKAKQYTGTMQVFGGALSNALEKKDIEGLTRLRTVHQQNLLKMTTRMREWDITIAADTVTTLERQQAAVQYRRDYYQALLDQGLSQIETVQQISRHAAGTLQTAAGLTDTLAGIFYLVPQVGSPFSMKYGGKETGDSSNAWAMVMKDAALVAEAMASSAGLEAGFHRRDEGWQHQVELADKELAQIAKQLTAAELRRKVAVKSLDVHNETMKQMDEVMEFYSERFGTLALYTWLSTTLQRTYRQAYNGAFAMARLAEQAYRYERGDETTPLLQMDYWDPTRAGLLAGERLMVDLQAMERRFIETNYRTLEIDQAFSLTQIDADALLRLREEGACDFELAELFYDLFYPGQYRRRISSVRLTIPCITGPYTNVGATLTLTGSKIRNEPKLGAANLVDVPLRRSVSVATSTAQNDAGVFEFSFRDERYMPFEGAGAVSTWRLQLPKSFRQFDYQTITDVILHVSYKAEEDGPFRAKVEEMNAAVEGTILNTLTSVPLGRLLSLRQDFSSAFNRLLHSPADTPVKIEVSDKYLPIFLRAQPLQVTKAVMAIKHAPGQSIAGFQLALDNTLVSSFAPNPALGNLRSANVAASFAGGMLGVRTLTLKAAGDLAPTPVPGDVSPLDAGKLLDIVLYLEFQAQ